MLKSIRVDGFRSLERLTIPIKPGLNVLVGPNGGGKTNILSCFEFISSLTRHPVDEAVSIAGGLSKVFTRKPDNQYADRISCSIQGKINFQTAGGFTRRLWYGWEFTIKAINNNEDIVFDSQKIYVDIEGEPRTLNQSDLILSMSLTERGAVLKVDRLVVSRLQNLLKSFLIPRDEAYVRKEDADRLLRLAARTADISRNPIFRALPQSGGIVRRIVADLSGGETFNLSPDACKSPEDAARPPIIEKNGAGLAATLHRVNRSHRIFAIDAWTRLRRPIGTTEQREKINSYISLINDQISGFTTDKNLLDNQISVLLQVEEQDGYVSFPLSQCSDGTVKWVALVTKIITSDSGFSLEEPENFLHPHAQREFVSLIRREMAQSPNKQYILLTSHSESLINHTNPDEIIIVWMEKGVTKAKRVENRDLIVEEINRTGFGLGYYYLTGAMEIG